MFPVKALYITFFFLALCIDYSVRNNFLGDKIKLYYLRFVQQNYIYVSFSIFLFLMMIFSILSYLDISLFFNNEPYFNLDVKTNMSTNYTLPESIASTSISSDSNSTSQLVPRLLSDSTGESLENKFTSYPLNLLVEVNQLINVEILFLTVMLNIFIVHKLLNVDYLKYIPNNKFGSALKIIIARYINIWSKASIFLLVLSWLMLTSSVFLIKFCLLQLS